MRPTTILDRTVWSALAALFLAMSGPAIASTPQGVDPSKQLDSGAMGAPRVPSQPTTSTQFTTSPAVANPFVTVTFRYHFPAPEAGTYVVRCLRKDQADNQPELSSKDLTSERRDGWISGSFSRQLPNDPSRFGQYSFRIFGPRRYLASPGGFMQQPIYSVKTEKLFDAGTFILGPYATRLIVPAQIPPRRTLRITWTDASAHQAAWIGIFKRENSNEYPIVRKSFANIPGGAWDIEAPAQLGHYQVRAFIDHGFQTTAVQPFEVTWGTLNPVLSGYPASCYPNVSLVVSYANGPPEINALVGIFDATNLSTASPLSWQSLQGKTSGEFVFSAPGYPGSYDVRMVDSARNQLARSTPFQVVQASATIRLNAQNEAGRVVLTWNNPANYQWLAGYYVYRGTAPGQPSATPLTVGPIPTDRTAAASTQKNFHVDAEVQPGMTYYYIVKPLQNDLKTFGPPSNEVSVTLR